MPEVRGCTPQLAPLTSKLRHPCTRDAASFLSSSSSSRVAAAGRPSIPRALHAPCRPARLIGQAWNAAADLMLRDHHAAQHAVDGSELLPLLLLSMRRPQKRAGSKAGLRCCVQTIVLVGRGLRKAVYCSSSCSGFPRAGNSLSDQSSQVSTRQNGNMHASK